MVMANLLYGTCKPHVMDIKIGQRTFQEDEVTNQKTRMDLLKKMMDVDPNEPTEEEKVPVTWRIVNIERCLGAKSLFQLKTCISRNSSEPCRTSLVHIQEKGITKFRASHITLQAVASCGAHQLANSVILRRPWVVAPWSCTIAEPAPPTQTALSDVLQIRVRYTNVPPLPPLHSLLSHLPSQCQLRRALR
jgi:hypothetical protein